MGRFFVLFVVAVVSVFGGASPAWIDRAVEGEFSRFVEKGISQDRLEKTWDLVSKNKNFKRYQIIRSKVYGPTTPLKDLLKVLVKKFPVPDVDFIYYHQDVLRDSDFKKSKKYAPILVSAKDRSEDRLILFIDWYYKIEDQNGGWNGLIKEIDQNINKWRWSDKIEKALWRGNANDALYSLDDWMNAPRGRSVYLSKFVYPDLVDAAFTSYWKFKRDEEKQLLAQNVGVSPSISPSDQMEYKYLLDIDGVTCTYPSLQWKLLTGSCVMKQVTSDTMWYYRELFPWVHYIPLKEDLSDLGEKVMWAKMHDAEARKIGENGREFVKDHLMPEYILLYCFKVLKKYASLQKFDPKKQ